MARSDTIGTSCLKLSTRGYREMNTEEGIELSITVAQFEDGTTDLYVIGGDGEKENQFSPIQALGLLEWAKVQILQRTEYVKLKGGINDTEVSK